MNHAQHNALVGFIWSIADDVLRDVYVRGKYRDVILPMTVIRRLDALLEPTKDAVLSMKKHLDEAKVANQDAALCNVAGQAFYNASPFTLRRLLDSPKQLRANFDAYLGGFSANVQEILAKFKFHNQIQTLADADALGHMIEKFISPDINLSPRPVLDGSGAVKLPGLDNHSMGTVFEELIRRFNEENNEEAGEHFTPRDVVRLMANLILLPIADAIESGTYLVYDGASGTGGMLTVAEESLSALAAERGKEVAIHLYGQEVNPETYAITRADLLIKGEGEEAENVKFGSTLSNDGFPGQCFDFMLSNPPYGKSWKMDLDRMCSGDKKELRDPRFVLSHADEPEFSLVTRSSDGQLMFLANMLAKMKAVTPRSPLGSRIAEVHNGSSLFTGDAGQGESNIRRWIIENDWLEAIIALPLDMFYNTGIATYIWVLTNNKPDHRKGKVQLIDATTWYQSLRKNLGKKNCELGEEHLGKITDTFLRFEESGQSKIFPNAAFGYWKITVERPLRLRSQFTKKAIEGLRFAAGDEEWRRRLYEQFGADLYGSFGKIRKDIEAQLAQPEATEDDGDGNAEGKPKIPEKTRKRLLDELSWDRDHRLMETARKLAERLGHDLHPDYNVFREQFDAAARDLGLKLSASDKKAIVDAISWRDPEAPPIIKKTRKDGTVEYEPDPELRDTEQVPFLEPGGVEAFFKRECLPYVPDAWIDEGKTKIGYEISFTRYFYKPQPLRTLDEIKADILAAEKESEGLLERIVGASIQ
jgi:type I restriction enzyme M protein